MTSRLCSYEASLALKEAGFPQDCKFAYIDNVRPLPTKPWLSELSIDGFIMEENSDQLMIMAHCPQKVQATDWLRNEKDVFITMFPHRQGWIGHIYKDRKLYHNPIIAIGDYSKALDVLIRMACESLSEKKENDTEIETAPPTMLPNRAIISALFRYCNKKLNNTCEVGMDADEVKEIIKREIENPSMWRQL